jgi:hypothetical protein
MCDASGQGVMYSQAVAQRLGINSTDLECLDHIVLRGPLTAGALAELRSARAGSRRSTQGLGFSPSGSFRADRTAF